MAHANHVAPAKSALSPRQTTSVEHQIVQLQQTTSQVLELFQRIVDKANLREKKNHSAKVPQVEVQKYANSLTNHKEIIKLS